MLWRCMYADLHTAEMCSFMVKPESKMTPKSFAGLAICDGTSSNEMHERLFFNPPTGQSRFSGSPVGLVKAEISAYWSILFCEAVKQLLCIKL